MPSFTTILATERNGAAQHQDPSPVSQPFDLPALTSSLADKSPQDILKAAFEYLDDEPWISFNGAKDVVLIDMAWKLNHNVKVFGLDIGCLHPETYRFISQVREHYGIAADVLSPNPCLLEPLAREKSLFSFHRNGHGECCDIRKIEPLKRRFVGVHAWATSRRRGQGPGTRSRVVVLEIGDTFPTSEKLLYKFDPLSSMTNEEVWGYIRMLELPYNSSHEHGYINIDCEPYTRSMLPDQYKRKGHWWWEEATREECGLHTGNLISKA